MAEENSELKEVEQQAIDAKRQWVGGVALIGLGVIFLLHSLDVFHLNNWWALFILLPALVSFNNAWYSYRQHGRLTNKARGSIMGGLILSLVAGIFLFGWSWSVMWPVFLILGGLSVMFNK